MEERKRQPLKPPRYFILLALAEHDSHGAEIQREVLRLSSGQVRLWPTMLYRTLEALRLDSWIEELTGPEDRPAGESERKRYYRITDQGRQALRIETQRLSELVEVARLRNRRRKEETA